MKILSKLFLGLVLIAVLVLPSVSHAYATNLKFGSRGADVTALQKGLISEGFSIKAGATGYFGHQTQAALSSRDARAAFLLKNGTSAVLSNTSNVVTTFATDRPVSNYSSVADCEVGHKFSSKTGKSCPSYSAVAQSSLSPVCTLTADKLSYNLGDMITFSWKSNNATYAWFWQDTSGFDFLHVPADKLEANGSQQVIADGYGNPTVTLRVGSPTGTGSCSKTVNVVYQSTKTSTTCTNGDLYDRVSGVRCTNTSSIQNSETDEGTPYIHITASSGSKSSDTAISVNQGDVVVISGAPQNLDLSAIPVDFYRVFSGVVGPNDCWNNAPADSIWKMTCTANNTNTVNNYHIEISKNGKTYKSNDVRVSVIPTKKDDTTNLSLIRKCGLTVTSVLPNARVNFPLTISGTIDNSNSKSLGCSWQMFEGQAGIAQMYFNYNNEGWNPLGVSVPIKVSNWTATKTSFGVTLNFYNGGMGLPNGTPLKITFTEENASGLPPIDTFSLPVVLINSPLDLTRIDLDHNGQINGADLTIVLSAYGRNCETSHCPEDINQDGVINSQDKDLVINNYSPVQTNVPVLYSTSIPNSPDINNDGVVNGADLTMLLHAWGTCGAICREDLTGDGQVSEIDRILLLGAWTPAN